MRLQKLNAEIETIEESLQEERMERVKLEVEIGREKDCNRVRRTSGSPCLLTSIHLHTRMHRLHSKFYSIQQPHL